LVPQPGRPPSSEREKSPEIQDAQYKKKKKKKKAWPSPRATRQKRRGMAVAVTVICHDKGMMTRIPALIVQYNKTGIFINPFLSFPFRSGTGTHDTYTLKVPVVG
jgi:hypothetical protein